MQPGLTKVLAETTGSNTTAFIHGPCGIQAREDDAGTWTHYLQDGLGSVRGLANASGAMTQDYAYEPYGTPDGAIPAELWFYGRADRPQRPGVPASAALRPGDRRVHVPRSLRGNDAASDEHEWLLVG